MMSRYAISIVTGVVVTLSLLFVMQLLIASGKKALTKPRERAKLEFVRVKRNENLNTQDLTPEKPKKESESSHTRSSILRLGKNLGDQVTLRVGCPAHEVHSGPALDQWGTDKTGFEM